MKIVINTKYNYLKEFIDKLHFQFDQNGEVIYDERNKLKSYFIKNTPIVVKRFKTPILINQFAYSFIRKSKAERSYENAIELVRIGSLTPEPIAYIEVKRKGLLKESYYVCIFDNVSENIREYMDGRKEDPALLREVATFASFLHKKNVYHLDFSSGNILVNKTIEKKFHFSIIDINRLIFKRLSEEERYKNFSRLCYSYKVSSEIARYYAQENGLDEEQTIHKINMYSDRFFMNKAYSTSFRKTKRMEGLYVALIGPFYFFLICSFVKPDKLSQFQYDKVKYIYNKYVKEYDDRCVFPRLFKF